MGGVSIASGGKVLTVGGGGVVRAVSSTKAVIAESDFTYLGCFRVPITINGSDGTDYGYGLTHRYVGGQLRLFSTCGGPYGHRVYEMTPPATLDTDATPDTYATEVEYWGDIYQSERYLYKAAGTGGDVWGLHWDATDERLYWTYQDAYNSGPGDDCCIGYSTLDDNTATGTAVAAWRFPTSVGCKVVKGMTAIPSSFATTYLSGKRLGVGFGGYESVYGTGPASMGPALFAIDPPSLGTTSSRDYLPTPTTLINHPANSTEYTRPMRGQRDTNYTTEFDNWQPNAGIGYFTWSDLIRQSGVWIDTPTKHGFVVAAVMGNGRVWYETSTGHATSGSHYWMVYDPDDLASVAQGSLDSDLIVPTNTWLPEYAHITYPMDGWQDEAPRLHTGMTFDETTNRLYVMVRLAFRPSGDFADRPLVYVFELST